VDGYRLLTCQSGSWLSQSLALSYEDYFQGDGFATGPNYCSSSPMPQRTYELNLDQDSVVLLLLIGGRSGGGAFAGIGFNGSLCGYDAHMGDAQYATTTAQCALKLLKGYHIINYCINSQQSNVRGSIIVIPVGK